MEKSLLNTEINEFVSLISKGLEAWVKAGEIVVKLIDDLGFTIEEITDKSEFLTRDIVCKFEMIGRKQILPNLLISDFPAASRMLRLPYSEQKRVWNEPISVLVLNNGRPDEIKIEARNLTPLQCRQVFDSSQIRTIAHQRAWLESEKSKSKLNESSIQVSPYTIRGKRVVFKNDCELTAKEVALILAEMEK